jgi:hypothetical protein
MFLRPYVFGQLQKRHDQVAAGDQPHLPLFSCLFLFPSSAIVQSNLHQCDPKNLLKICLRIRIELELSPSWKHHPAMMIACSIFHASHHLGYHHYSLHFFFPFISFSPTVWTPCFYFNTILLLDLHSANSFHW